VCSRPATEVHHTIAHHGNPAIFWDKTLWESRCKPHYSSATMRELNARRRRA
jgi:hypothetical protein